MYMSMIAYTEFVPDSDKYYMNRCIVKIILSNENTTRDLLNLEWFWLNSKHIQADHKHSIELKVKYLLFLLNSKNYFIWKQNTEN